MSNQKVRIITGVFRISRKKLQPVVVLLQVGHSFLFCPLDHADDNLDNPFREPVFLLINLALEKSGAVRQMMLFYGKVI